MACELCRRSKVKINSVNIQYNEALQKLAKNIRGEYNPNQKNQILLICEQCEENVMKQYKSELIEDSFQDNTESKEAIIINEEEIKPKIEKDPLADDVIVQRQELHSEENNCYTKDNKSTVDNTGIIKEEEMEYSLTNEVEIQENILDSGEQQTGTDSSVQVFDIIVKEEPRFHEDDHVMPENMEDINDNSTSEAEKTPDQKIVPIYFFKSAVKNKSSSMKKISKKHSRRNKARENGKPYYSLSRKKENDTSLALRSERKIKPGCTSKKCATTRAKKCKDIPEEPRKEIFNSFWNDLNWNQKRSYVISLVTKKRISRKTKSIESRRNCTLEYYLEVNDQRFLVCKKMFLNTLGLGEKQVLNWVKRSNVEENFDSRSFVKMQGDSDKISSEDSLLQNPTENELTDSNSTCPSEMILLSEQSELTKNRRSRRNQAREKGMPYYSFSQKKEEPNSLALRSERKIKPGCTSVKCAINQFKMCKEIPEEKRFEIFNSFWNNLNWDEKKSYIVSLIAKKRISRKIRSIKSRRNFTMQYYLEVNHQRLLVCKKMFLNTLGLGETQVLNWVKKSNEESKLTNSRKDSKQFEVKPLKNTLSGQFIKQNNTKYKNNLGNNNGINELADDLIKTEYEETVTHIDETSVVQDNFDSRELIVGDSDKSSPEFTCSSKDSLLQNQTDNFSVDLKPSLPLKMYSNKHSELIKNKNSHENRADNWKRSKIRKAREKGMPYYSFSRKKEDFNSLTLRCERKIKPGCSSIKCKNSQSKKCNEIPEETRNEIFNSFWNDLNWDLKKSYVISLVTKERISRKTTSMESRRKFTLQYYLEVNHQRLLVCKRMFLSTLGLGESQVLNWVKSSE